MVICQPKFQKQSGKSGSNTLQKLFNDALRHGNFPDKLKCAEVMPVFKKMIQQKQRIIFIKLFTSKYVLTLTNFCPFTCMAMLILMDLSKAFDTISHEL